MMEAPDTEIELTVYQHIYRVIPRENGRSSIEGRDEATDLVLDPPSEARVRAIPHLSWVRIHNGAEYCRDRIAYRCEDVFRNPDKYWFVHYSDREEMWFGEGTVLILERGTGNVAYHGSDGGE